MLSLRGEFTRTDHELNVQNGFAHLRYNVMLREETWLEAFGQVQGDSIRRLRIRSLLGLGPRLGLFQSASFDMYLGVAYMLEREVINVEPGAHDDPDTLSHRASTYLSMLYEIDKRFSISGVLYYQPRFDQLSDFRILSDVSLASGITSVVSVKLELNIKHDSDPPTGVKPSDLTLRNVISLTF